MKTAKDFLADIKAAHGLTTDYQLAKFLGWRQQRIVIYNAGGSFDHETALQIAPALDLRPDYIMACMEAQRAKTPAVRKTWEKAAKALAGTALAAIVGCSALMDPSALDITFLTRLAAAPNIHYANLTAFVILTKTAACGTVFALLLIWTLRTCSVRSSLPRPT